MIKKAQGGDENVASSSRDIISLVAQQWGQTTQAEKQMWQFRAEQMKHAGMRNPATEHAVDGLPNASALEEIPELPPDSYNESGAGGDKNKRARKRRCVATPPQQAIDAHSVSV